MSSFSAGLYAARRNELFDRMRGACERSIAIFASAPSVLRNNDTEHAYRQDSNFQYLSGFDEPESVLVLDAFTRKTTLFVRARDPEREVWDGARAGVDGATSQFGADAAFEVRSFWDELPKLLAGRKRLYMRLPGADRSFDGRVLDALGALRAKTRTAAYPPSEIVDPGELVHEMRLLKGTDEVDLIRTACSISADAHRAAMAFTRPGMAEFEVESVLIGTFRRRGAERLAYGSIVGSGPNACVLHYVANNRVMQEGELLLVDAGCEYGYYASDITRTFPVSGEFSATQQAIYETVLDAELACIEAVGPGATIDGIHAIAVETLVRGLVKLGLLAGDVREIIEKESYKRFYMHRTSHWLGMDVHDVGQYYERESSRALAPGMLITVEPGIYISPTDDTVPHEFRGIGVRIEDDILVTSGGHENLTIAAPKQVNDLYAACR